VHSTPCFPTRRGNARFTPSRSLQRASRTLGALSSPIAPAARTSDTPSLRGLPRQSAIASAGVGPQIVLRRSSGRTREPRLPTPSRVNGHWFRVSPRRLIRLPFRTVSFGPATRTARSSACFKRRGGCERRDAAVSPTQEHSRVPRSSPRACSPERAVLQPRFRSRASHQPRLAIPRACHRFPDDPRRTSGAIRPEVRFVSSAAGLRRRPASLDRGPRPRVPIRADALVAAGRSSGMGHPRHRLQRPRLSSVRRCLRTDARPPAGCLPPRTSVEEPEPFFPPPTGEPARGTPFVPAISRRP
jgi:hypothetical protein